MVGYLALPAHQQPTAAVEPSMCPLDNPPARPLTLAFLLTHFLSPTANMNPIAAPRCLVPRARIIRAEVETHLVHPGCVGGALSHQAVERLGQEPVVIAIGRPDHEG